MHNNNNKYVKLLLLSTLTTSLLAFTQAGYVIKYNLKDQPITFKDITSYPSLYGDWTKLGTVFDCINWNPDPQTIKYGTVFEQSSNECNQKETRVVTLRELEKNTQVIKVVGTKNENRVILVNSTRSNTGKLDNWIVTTPLYSDWLNSGEISNCSNWSPAPSTITINQIYLQTATDCSQLQMRTKQNREIGENTQVIRNSGTLTTENRSTTVSNTRQSIGTKESWLAIIPLYTDWSNVDSVYNCTNWSPAETTITIGQLFTQTANDCKQNQTRTRQNREQESTTNEIRNVGSTISESQNITVSSTRSATGTKETWAAITPTYTEWVNNGSITNCTNWSPAVSSMTVGATFTQTATDCQQSQVRNKQNREQESTTNEIRNVGSAISESQNITVSSTRSATGTKETWVSATPIYGNWTVTNNLYSCTNWTPTGASKTVSGTFVQTATNCKTDRTRTVQNREQETTTLAYRNVGSIVNSPETLVNQTATRNYTVTVGTWVNNGSITNCTNWSPATSSVNKAIGFTQTATDCQIPQTRTRVERYVDHNTGGTVTVVNTNENQTGVTSNTRAAVGTNAVRQCYYNKDSNSGNWRFWADGNSIWTGSSIPNTPSIWARLFDFVVPFSNPLQVVPNTTKISDVEIRYSYGSYTWSITRGAYLGVIEGYQMYQICIQ